MRTVVTEEKEKETLLIGYRAFVNKRSLIEFSKKSGYGQEFIVVLFKEDLEDDLYSFSNELKEMKDNQVILMADPPASLIEENLYLDFDEFYDYLVDAVNRKIKKNPDEKDEYEQLLENVKIALEV